MDVYIPHVIGPLEPCDSTVHKYLYLLDCPTVGHTECGDSSGRQLKLL